MRLQSILYFSILFGLIAACQSNRAGENKIQFKSITTGDFVTDSSSSPSASWIDFDEDGDDDLYVLNGFGSLEDPYVPQKNKLYENNGKGNFTLLPNHDLVQDVTFSGSSVWADYDNDGDTDVFVANQQNADNYLFRNEGDGSFTRITEGAIVNDGGRSFSAAWVDIDNDGWLDLHVFNGRSVSEGQADFLYRNLGDGSFEKITGLNIVTDVYPSGGGMWGDYDEDGDVDLLLPVNSSSGKNQVYRNEGDWNFINITGELNLSGDPLPYSPSSSTVHWVDYDNDLDLDIFIGNLNTIDFLFENQNDGTFTRITAGRLGLDITYVSDVIWEDFDNDADLDMLVANWGGASEFFENNGEGEFYPVDAGDFGDVVNFASSASANDVDGDGDMDVYLTHWPINEAGGEPNQFYLNEGVSGNWIKIELEGTESNKSAISAQIIVTAEISGEMKKQLRTVSSRTSWRSTGSLTKHFGLADAEEIHEIEVIWPSGNREAVNGPIEVNRTLEIKEGSGIVD